MTFFLDLWTRIEAYLMVAVVSAAIGLLTGLALDEHHQAQVAANKPAQICKPVTKVIHDAVIAARASAKAEEKVIYVHDHVSEAAASASASVSDAPSDICPSGDPDALDAWRNGIRGVRNAAAAPEQ